MGVSAQGREYNSKLSAEEIAEAQGLLIASRSDWWSEASEPEAGLGFLQGAGCKR